MAVNIIKRTWHQNQMVKIEPLNGFAFQAENGGHTFEISGIDDSGNAVPISGTIAGVFLRPDNTDVALTGSASGGVASVTLKAECYAVPGRFLLTVYATSGSNKGTIYAAMGTVSRTSSGAVSPAAASDVVDLVNRINAATATIPASYTTLLNAVAGDYSDTKTYAVKDFVWYNGHLYRCTTAITTAETWTASHWSQVVLADALNQDITDLKSAMQDRTLYSVTNFDNVPVRKGYIVNSMGKNALSSSGVAINNDEGLPYIYKGSTITVNPGYRGGYAIWAVPMTSSTPVAQRLELNRSINSGETIEVAHDGYLFCSAQTSDGSELPSDKTALEIISEALTINLLSGTVKDKIEEKIDKNQGAENAGKVLMVAQAGGVSPESIPAPTEFVEVKTNYEFGKVNSAGVITTYKSGIVSAPVQVIRGDYITVDNGLYLRVALYSSIQTNSTTFIKLYNWTNSGAIIIDADGYIIVNVSDAEHYNKDSLALPNTDYQYDTHIYIQRTAFDAIANIESTLTEKRTITNKTGLFEAQQAVASDWHLPFINVYDALGLGNNHQIPGTATTWSSSGTTDLTQKNVWMSDGTHPYRGVGLVDMYGRTIANQLALVSPSYHDGDGETSPSYWAGKRILWMGTSIPAGSDPDAGSGTGATYPQMVAAQLGATSVNIARGSSMLRVKSSTGLYNAIPFSHYARAITRMVAECDEIAANWANIYSDIPNAPSELTAENIATMKNHSFENLVVPYLDGTNTAPDLYVIDYGHNDYANGIDGKRDWWVQPTTENIESGLLAEDTYMVANDYANLKLALNNDLSGISDLREFAASVNRNCFQGACNFLITVILRYKPYARIVIVSDYN